MSPLVSILIPCYNSVQWIAATLDSALSQTHQAIEIIVVNDGSTDGSLDVAQRHASLNPSRIRVVTQSNAGASAARNHALQLAKGEWIQFLDADDLLAPDKISAQLNLLAPAPRHTLASGRWARFVQYPVEASFEPQPNYGDLSGVEFLQIFYETTAMMQPAAWLSPRSLLDQAGPWDEKLSLNDDGEYFARVMLCSTGIRFCSDAKVYYRSSVPGSLSRRCDAKAMQSAFRATSSIISGLLATDSSPRTRAAAAYGWKWLAFELYPECVDLSKQALRFSTELGGSLRPFPAGPRFQMLARIIGWKLAKRLRSDS